jgi:hypothetical protein
LICIVFVLASSLEDFPCEFLNFAENLLRAVNDYDQKSDFDIIDALPPISGEALRT